MGDKYIIELEDKPFHKEDGDFLYRVKGFNSLVFDMTGIGKLTPYTEPDLEQVKKEAYESGFVAGHLKAEKSGQKFYEDGYKRGLADAWDAARTIVKMSWEDKNKIFGKMLLHSNIFLDYTADEAIEIIRQYEQEKDAEIKVGDEVKVINSGNKYVIAWFIGDEVLGFAHDGTTCRMYKSYVRKTGRHFPEIASVLDRMREDGNQNRIQETMSDDY